MAQIVAGIYCKIVPLFVHKMGSKFPCTSTTKCVNISVSTQPFFTKQGPFYSQLDNQSYDHTIMELSDDIKIGLESLILSTITVATISTKVTQHVLAGLIMSLSDQYFIV